MRRTQTSKFKGMFQLFGLVSLVSHVANQYEIGLRYTDETIEDLDDEGNNDKCSVTGATLATELVDQEDIELEKNNVNDLSNEDKDYRYTSISCEETLVKQFRAIAQKLKKSPNSKKHFVHMCQEKKCLTPHNVEQDVTTRWNSTLMQLTSIVRCLEAILKPGMLSTFLWS
ncbi:hypothetical protein PSTG_08263 [Puccinia striiformis f. sp. tritici PST-78]|uniref:Uncharacterized protein n=1 Tax=Puccinia striiformis f. sp. tritici PST-78 TaxID=1165861 RepID=A0A0L0VGZ9_9BASI|nr:hypothetical protein PSTG_08263 [Puccinia striiformis f. sp. tritici PST-78]